MSRGGRHAPSGLARTRAQGLPLVSMGQGHPPHVNGTSFSSCLPTTKSTLTEMNIADTHVALSPQGTLDEWTWEGEQT